MKYICDDCGKATDGVGATFEMRNGVPIRIICAKCAFGNWHGVEVCSRCKAAWQSNRKRDKCKVCGYWADVVTLP